MMYLKSTYAKRVKREYDLIVETRIIYYNRNILLVEKRSISANLIGPDNKSVNYPIKLKQYF